MCTSETCENILFIKSGSKTYELNTCQNPIKPLQFWRNCTTNVIFYQPGHCRFTNAILELRILDRKYPKIDLQNEDYETEIETTSN